MRRKFVAGNWKMFTNLAVARKLAQDVAAGAASISQVDVAVCPPFPYLDAVAQALKGSSVSLGAQNCYHENEGAFTGEVSPTMLVDIGCKFVILGHSERRQKFGECDGMVNKKVHAALKAGLKVILALGETIEERQGNKTDEVLKKQLEGSMASLTANDLANVTLAYEPVWAIGTGLNATPQQAQDAHAFIRNWVAKTHSSEVGQKLRIQYGGSMKPENAASLLSQPDVDGGLIGGASLKADQFLAIIKAGI